MDFFCQSAHWASSTIGLFILHNLFFLQNLKILIFWGYFVKAASLWKISEAHVISFEESAWSRKSFFCSRVKGGRLNELTFFNILVARDYCDGHMERAWLKSFRIQLKARIFLLQGPWFYGKECRQLIWKRMGVDYFYFIRTPDWDRGCRLCEDNQGGGVCLVFVWNNIFYHFAGNDVE